jgi:hypothetical protein
VAADEYAVSQLLHSVEQRMSLKIISKLDVRAAHTNAHHCVTRAAPWPRKIRESLRRSVHPPRLVLTSCQCDQPGSMDVVDAYTFVDASVLDPIDPLDWAWLLQVRFPRAGCATRAHSWGLCRIARS